ncbi:TRAP transporter DctP subunit (plasmid) [Octadecabacter arcticus 238]|jgi:TRAP-type mannitol/chloroaromatic compound transport system substrate-binding protein|uniref:TRAP transporter DctP subunit n=1 Tax=Octadecabacter arcticus 238 TaxID=391616 RepID=M9RYH0_9RHOB|nr:TRAP transporter substrate-binding protein [Octadecabacter arcticus]AGI74900.1 TRAP transporter DctP subunit [Octadecabacter arcticus 238]
MKLNNILAGAVIAAALPLSSAIAQEYNWNFQAFMPAGSDAYTAFVDFTDRVEAMSDGRIKITPLPEDSVVSGREQLDAVASGILNGQFGSIGYNAGQDPAFGVLGNFVGGYDSPWQAQAFFDEGGGLELARELYSDYNVHFVAPVFWQGESIPSTIPITSVADFAGVKIRAPEGTVGRVFAEMGASVVGLPGSELFQALSTGLIEATDYLTLGQNAQVGLHESAKYAIYPGIHSNPTLEISVNADDWAELPDDLKAIVVGATRVLSVDVMQRTYLTDQAAAARLPTEEGVTLIDWSAEERRKLREISAGVMGEYATESDMAQRIYDSQVVFMRSIGLL